MDQPVEFVIQPEVLKVQENKNLKGKDILNKLKLEGLFGQEQNLTRSVDSLDLKKMTTIASASTATSGSTFMNSK
jgi:hypothetical protein